MSRLNTVIECHRKGQLYWLPNVFSAPDSVKFNVSIGDKYVHVPYVRYLVGHGPDSLYKEVFHAFF